MINPKIAEMQNWRTWVTLDDDGSLCTLGQLSERRSEAYRAELEIERHIAEQLSEKDAWPRRLIHVIIKHIGTDQALALMHGSKRWKPAISKPLTRLSRACNKTKMRCLQD